MKKYSAMGGGEFEFNPSKLDEKVAKRENFYNNAFISTNNFINANARHYQKLGLGTQENFKEEIIRRLIKDFRGMNDESRIE
nr:hypothetical protein [uncultured Cellulosilyticum sp.]